jgi:hypothetical protein
MAAFLSSFPPGSIPFLIGRQRLLRRVNPRLQCGQPLFNFQITIYDSLLIGPIQLARLAKREQMFEPPIAHQRFSDGLGVGLDVWIAQLGELGAVPLPSQDGVHNGQACQPGNITDDMVNLQNHLCQRLVHVLHVLTGRPDQLAAVPQKRPHGADVLFGPKRRPQ